MDNKDRAAIAIADARGIPEKDRTEGMMAVFRADAAAVLTSHPLPTEEEVARVIEAEKAKWGHHPYVVATADSLRKAILSMLRREE